MKLSAQSTTGAQLLLAGLLLLPTIASAHTLFLKPNAPQPDPDGRLGISLVNGTFWKSESAVRQDRLTDLTLVDAAGKSSDVDLAPWRVADETVIVEVNLGGEGTYVLGAATRSSVAQMTAKDFNRYLRYEGLKEQRASREGFGESETATSERYTKFAKAIIQVGPTPTDTFKTSLGHKVEIVPLVNPGMLRVGDTFKARIYLDGKPLAGERVFASPGNAQVTTPKDEPLEPLELISSKDGRIEFEVTEQGLWYVRFIRLERLGDSEYWYSDLLVWLGLEDRRVPYESFWATLTFRVP
jgi:uncharacterized GH25 family protein